MRLTEKESLEYLKDNGFEISDTTLFREKSKLEKMKLKRLYQIAKYGFEEQHLERIDNCELILKLMWQNAMNEKDPYRSTQILKEILSLQPYLSSYYDTTKEVMKESNYMKNIMFRNLKLTDTIKICLIQVGCNPDKGSINNKPTGFYCPKSSCSLLRYRTLLILWLL